MKTRILSIVMAAAFVLQAAFAFAGTPDQAQGYIIASMIGGAEKFKPIQGDFIKDQDEYQMYAVKNLAQSHMVVDQYISQKKKSKSLIAKINAENTEHFIKALENLTNMISGFKIKTDQSESTTTYTFGGGKLASATLTVDEKTKQSVYIVYGK